MILINIVYKCVMYCRNINFIWPEIYLPRHEKLSRKELEELENKLLNWGQVIVNTKAFSKVPKSTKASPSVN